MTLRSEVVAALLPASAVHPGDRPIPLPVLNAPTLPVHALTTTYHFPAAQLRDIRFPETEGRHWRAIACDLHPEHMRTHMHTPA